MNKSARFLLAAVALAGACAVSRQASGQARPTAEGPGSYMAVGGGASAFHDNYGQLYLGGGMVFVDMHPTWRYGLEAEGRWLNIHSNNAVTNEGRSDTNYFIGPQINILPGPFRPYVKLLVGDGHIVLPLGYGEGDFFTLAPGGGVEYMLTGRWTVRGDFEYQKWTKFPYGELTPYGVTVGVSFRVNGVSRYVKHAGRSRWH